MISIFKKLTKIIQLIDNRPYFTYKFRIRSSLMQNKGLKITATMS